MLVERRFKASCFATLLGGEWSVVSISGSIPEMVLADDVCQVKPKEGQRLAISPELLDLKQRARLAPWVLIATDPTEMGEIAAHFIATACDLKYPKKLDIYEVSEAGMKAALKRIRSLDQKQIDNYRHDRRHTHIIRLALKQANLEVMGRADYVPEIHERALLAEIVRLDRSERIAAHARNESLVLRCDDFLAQPVGPIATSELQVGSRTTARVISCRTRAEQELPPPALDFANLTALAANRLALSATEVHDLAYLLYLRGLISWPFTTSTALGAEGSDAARSVARTKRYPMFGDVSSDGSTYHPKAFAIRPLDFSQAIINAPELQGLYSLIRERALLSVLQPSMKKDRHVVVEVDSARGPLRFEARGQQAMTHGWREVAGPEFRLDGGESEPFLPLLNAGDTLIAEVLQQNSFASNSAMRLKESQLMRAFDRNQPLTPSEAVRALRNLIQGDYVRLQGQELVPTTFGVAVARLIESQQTISAAGSNASRDIAPEASLSTSADQSHSASAIAER